MPEQSMLEEMLALKDDPAKRPHPSMRFGQAVVVQFRLKNMKKLFFTTDDEEAEQIIRAEAEKYQW